MAPATRSRTRAGEERLVDPSQYPEERRSQRHPPPLTADQSPDSRSSASEADSEEGAAPPLIKPKMASATPAAPVAPQAGKPPILVGTSPRDLRTFTNHAKLYFILKKITDENERVL